MILSTAGWIVAALLLSPSLIILISYILHWFSD